MNTLERIHKAAEAIEKACGQPEIGIVLGSGLGKCEWPLENPVTVDYQHIPGFPVPTVEGHIGEWVQGTLGTKKVALMRGRFHGYEGHDLESLILPTRVMKQLGVSTLILTNAAGGVNHTFRPGDLMMITDIINFSMLNPLIGHNLDAYGPRFPDMTDAFDPALRKLAHKVADGLHIRLQQGVYMGFSGPSFETPAEIRMARTLGADAVGMSTVQETIVARQMGMRVLGFSCITNLAAGMGEPLSHVDVMEVGMRVKDTFSALIQGIVTAL